MKTILVVLLFTTFVVSGCATRGEVEELRQYVDECIVGTSRVLAEQRAKIENNTMAIMVLEQEIEAQKWEPVEWQRP